MRLRNKILLILFLFFGVEYLEAQQQMPKEMFKQKRSRKRVWRRWRSDKEAYNPYLKRKHKNKPSTKIAKGEKKEIRQQRRRERRQLKKAKRLTGN